MSYFNKNSVKFHAGMIGVYQMNKRQILPRGELVNFEWSPFFNILILLSSNGLLVLFVGHNFSNHIRSNIQAVLKQGHCQYSRTDFLFVSIFHVLRLISFFNNPPIVVNDYNPTMGR